MDSDAKVLEQARKLLAEGLECEVYPRCDTHESVQDVIQRLRTSDQSLARRLIIGGFTLDPIEYEGIEQACESCMYYLVHRQYCELPELDVPVGPKWSCRLWRI